MKQVNFEIEDDTHRRLKIISAIKSKPMNKVMAEALAEYGADKCSDEMVQQVEGM